ncbi:MAG: FkbM family methyltransferase, partial [Bacteroidota bacterium]
FQRCAYNFKLNEFNHLLVEHVAVGRCTGTLYFDSMPLHNSGGAVMSSTSSSQSVAVQMTSIDEYVRLHAFAKVDFIKIDVEGYEMEVLIGAEHVLRKFHPVLCIEVNDEHLRRFGSSEAELLGFLRDHRYSIHVLTPKVLSKSGAWHFDILAEPTVSELEGDLTTQGDGR